MKRRIGMMTAILCGIWLSTSVAETGGQTIEVSLQGRVVQGRPVYWDDGFVAIMQRDGQFITFQPNEAEGFRKVSPRFDTISQADLRGMLMREFGNGFDVSGTGQYLVVHPVHQRDRWADRFEQLYRSMTHYFTARGFRVNRPEFPFVAVVFHSRAEYLEYIQRVAPDVSPNTLGFYDAVTNRIHLFDVTADQRDERQWYLNAETIIHEAAHQTAYNIGIHRRYADTPAWVVEGIGTMFEARGVWDSRSYPNREHRSHPQQLKTYFALLASDRSVDPVNILNLQIASDQLFDRNPTLAYAHAWALTFFLTEQEPRRYADYIRRVYAQEAFADYPAEARMKDFTAVFGTDLKMLDARLHRFLETLQ